MQNSEDMGEVSASSGSQMDKVKVFPEDYDISTAGNSTGDDGHQPIPQEKDKSVSESSTPARALQPLVPIAGSQAKDYTKACFVQIQPCYPFGMANVDEKMLVVTPDDDLSRYADALVSTNFYLLHCTQQEC